MGDHTPEAIMKVDELSSGFRQEPISGSEVSPEEEQVLPVSSAFPLPDSVAAHDTAHMVESCAGVGSSMLANHTKQELAIPFWKIYPKNSFTFLKSMLQTSWFLTQDHCQ